MAFDLPPQAGPARDVAIMQHIVSGDFEAEWYELDSAANGHTATFRVTGDALKIGGVRINVSARLQQGIADVLGAFLPTPKILDLMWLSRAATLSPVVLPISSSTAAMVQASQMIDAALAAQDNPKGIIPAGKSWMLDNDLLAHPSKAENYGFYVLPNQSGNKWSGIATEACVTFPTRPDLGRVIQGRGWAHDPSHTDYSQLCWLVSRNCYVDGQPLDLASVLVDPTLSALASHQGPLQTLRQPGVASLATLVKQPPCVGPNCPKLVSWEPGSEEFSPSSSKGPLILSAIALTLVVGGFLGGMALMGRVHERNPRFPKEYQYLVDAAVKSGWNVTITAKNHVKFLSPTGAVVFASGTPSDKRAVLNVRSDLRRAGLHV